MESWENKIIADKLDSLGDLPEGYTPNLSSKWEIIQTGLAAKKPLSFNKKWRLGLFLTFLLTATVWTFFTTKSENPKPTAATAKSTTGFTEEKTAKIVRLQTPRGTAERKQPANQIRKQTVVNKRKVATVDTVFFTPTSKPSPLFTNDSIYRVPIDTIKAFAPIAELKTKPKAKIYQKDFNGIISQVDSNQNKTARKGFQVKFGTVNTKEPSSGQPPALRLIQNF